MHANGAAFLYIRGKRLRGSTPSIWIIAALENGKEWSFTPGWVWCVGWVKPVTDRKRVTPGNAEGLTQPIFFSATAASLQRFHCELDHVHLGSGWRPIYSMVTVVVCKCNFVRILADVDEIHVTVIIDTTTNSKHLVPGLLRHVQGILDHWNYYAWWDASWNLLDDSYWECFCSSYLGPHTRSLPRNRYLLTSTHLLGSSCRDKPAQGSIAIKLYPVRTTWKPVRMVYFFATFSRLVLC